MTLITKILTFAQHRVYLSKIVAIRAVKLIVVIGILLALLIRHYL